MVPGPLGEGLPIEADTGQTHYLAHVLRLAAGGEVLVFDGAGGEWLARLDGVSKRGASLTCLRQTRPQDAVPDLTLAFAPIKGDRLDAIVEKATELGARRLVPVITERTIVRKVRPDRLEATAREAAEQTGRLSVPVIEEAVGLARLLDTAAPEKVILFADEAGDAPPVAHALDAAMAAVTLLVGPEGGFTEAERRGLRARAGVRPVSLGPRILRADTACLAGLSLVQACWGDWRAPIRA